MGVGVGVPGVNVEATSCVTNASPNVGVGTVVCVATSVMNGLVGLGSVATGMGDGDEVGGTPPKGVGVLYCPQSETFPPQDASKNEAVIKKLIRRFTKLIR